MDDWERQWENVGDSFKKTFDIPGVTGHENMYKTCSVLFRKLSCYKKSGKAVQMLDFIHEINPWISVLACLHPLCYKWQYMVTGSMAEGQPFIKTIIPDKQGQRRKEFEFDLMYIMGEIKRATADMAFQKCENKPGYLRIRFISSAHFPELAAFSPEQCTRRHGSETYLCANFYKLWIKEILVSSSHFQELKKHYPNAESELVQLTGASVEFMVPDPWCASTEGDMSQREAQVEFILRFFPTLISYFPFLNDTKYLLDEFQENCITFNAGCVVLIIMGWPFTPGLPVDLRSDEVLKEGIPRLQANGQAVYSVLDEYEEELTSLAENIATIEDKLKDCTRVATEASLSKEWLEQVETLTNVFSSCLCAIEKELEQHCENWNSRVRHKNLLIFQMVVMQEVKILLKSCCEKLEKHDSLPCLINIIHTAAESSFPRKFIVNEFKSLKILFGVLKRIDPRVIGYFKDMQLLFAVNSTQLTVDNVPCLKLAFWPDIAKEWPTRSRKWPSADIVSAIVAQGVHIVPKSSQRDNPDDTEWRYSFSEAECKLSEIRSKLHSYCYYMFKGLFYRLFTGKYEDKHLPSYVVKTIMFWVSEKHLADWWCEERMGRCLEALLKELEKCLENKFVPHYFIPQINILADYPEQLIQMNLDVIKTIMKEPLRNLHIGKLYAEYHHRCNDIERDYPLSDWAELASDCEKVVYICTHYGIQLTALSTCTALVGLELAVMLARKLSHGSELAHGKLLLQLSQEQTLYGQSFLVGILDSLENALDNKSLLDVHRVKYEEVPLSQNKMEKTITKSNQLNSEGLHTVFYSDMHNIYKEISQTIPKEKVAILKNIFSEFKSTMLTYLEDFPENPPNTYFIDLDYD